MDKDIAYHALKDGTKDDCCPICALTDKSVRQVMKNFLYEGMTDVAFRSEIMEARGFCGHHAGVFLEEGDCLAHAIVYSDAIRGALKDVVSDNYDPYEKEKDCFFCKYARQSQEIYERVCYEALHEEEYLETYKKGGILCMTHLNAIRILSEKHKDGENFYLAVAQATINKYQSLLEELDEIQRKNDYRFASENFTDGERTAWRRAVAVINDRVGLPKLAREKKKKLFGRK